MQTYAAEPAEPVTANSPTTMDQREFKQFRELVHRETGIWLRDGKAVMLSSRLSRRLRHHAMTGFAEYYAYVESGRDSNEMRELINCVTTNKTSFFRESFHFDFLAKTLLGERQQAAARGGPRSIRIWSAACSTGEEPYSIAITLIEALSATATGAWATEVIASDIDTNVLETAGRGTYPEESLTSVAAPLRHKYFLRGKDDMAGLVRIKREVRQRVTFKNINLMDTRWPVDGLFDAIFFRNALIYFNQDTQSVFLRRMVRYLSPGGYLFLGHSEHVPWLHDVVTPLNHTIYRLRSDVAR